jgi:hypothetical protein
LNRSEINKSGARTGILAGALVFTGNTTVIEGILAIATDDVFHDNSLSMFLGFRAYRQRW